VNSLHKYFSSDGIRRTAGARKWKAWIEIYASEVVNALVVDFFWLVFLKHRGINDELAMTELLSRISYSYVQLFSTYTLKDKETFFQVLLP
jgi:hypothetical protein